MKLAAFLVLSAISASCIADNYVNGYTRRDGTYVQPHFQTQGDRNPYNNYSTQGNSNPYTGQQGSRDPYQVQQQYAPQPQRYDGSMYGQQRQRNGW